MKKFLIVLFMLIGVTSCYNRTPTMEEQAQVVLAGERERLPLKRQYYGDDVIKIQIDTIITIGVNEAYLITTFTNYRNMTKEIYVPITDIKVEDEDRNIYVLWNSDWPSYYSIF
jgi:hypothetical protein